MDSVELNKVYISPKGSKLITGLAASDKKKKKKDQHIWNLVNQNAQYWSRHQPYRKLCEIDSTARGYMIRGIGSFYLVP